MSKIDSSTARSSFFPRTKSTSDSNVKSRALQSNYPQRNAPSRMKELENSTSAHAKVDIPNAVKDYAKIKKAVDQAPDIDNSARIASLKGQIQAGTYSVDFDKLAEKILSSEY